MQKPFMLALILSIALSACTSLSFSPPPVDLTGKLKPQDVDQAGVLVDTYLNAYRRAASAAANGRQWFQVPALLALAGGATAVGLGAGSDVAIATGAGAAILNGVDAYYAPKDKVPILYAAINAIVCIKQESVGVPALKIPQAQAIAEQAPNAQKADGSGLAFSLQEQYFSLVVASLIKVESILAQRLSNVGQYSPEAIVSEITMLTQQKTEAEGSADDADAQAAALGITAPEEKNAVSGGIVTIATLKPVLETCAVRAKV